MRKKGKRFLINICIGIAVIYACHWLSYTPFGASSVNYYSDYVIYSDAVDAVERYTAGLGSPGSADGPGTAIRFLDIDQETHLVWGEPLLTPRDKLAEIVKAADKAGVKVLVLDVLLDKPSDKASDDALRRALKGLAAKGSTMKVVLAASTRSGTRIEPAVIRDILADCPRCYLGAADVLANGSDRVVRDLRYFRITKDDAGAFRLVWSVPFLASVLYYDAEDQLPALEASVMEQFSQRGAEGIHVPWPKPWQPGESMTINSGGTIAERIRFRLIPPGVFSSASLTDLLLGERFQFKQLPYMADDLKGSLLVVGNSFEGCCDVHYTPVGDMAGMYILGNSVNTLIGHHQVREIPSALLWGIEILSLLAFAYWLPLKRSSLEAVCSVALLFATFGVYILLMKWNIFIDNTFMFFGTSLYLLLIGIVDDVVDLYKWLTQRGKKRCVG